MRNICLQVILFCAAAATAAAQTDTAAILGTVTTGPARKALAAAFVSATREGLPALTRTGVTGADGNFTLQSLGAGTYTLCVQVPNSNYLNSCQWAAPVKVTLAAGQRLAGIGLQAVAGSVVEIRIDDPVQVLSLKTRDGRTPGVQVGVKGPDNRYHHAYPAQRDATGVNYRVAVPLDTPVRLQLTSRDLNLANAAGVALAATGDEQAFQHAANDQNPRSFRYSVLGLRP